MPNRGVGTKDTDVTGKPPLCLQIFCYIQRYYITNYHSLSIVFKSPYLDRARLRRQWPASPLREVQNKYDGAMKVRLRVIVVIGGNRRKSYPEL